MAAPSWATTIRARLNLVDGDRIRTLSPRELARAQGFPEGYQIPEARGLASTLIGNAIHCDVAHGVVAQTVEALW